MGWLSRNCLQLLNRGLTLMMTTLLRLASKVDSIIESLENDKQKVGTEISKKALSYLLKLISNKMLALMAVDALSTWH